MNHAAVLWRRTGELSARRPGLFDAWPFLFAWFQLNACSCRGLGVKGGFSECELCVPLPVARVYKVRGGSCLSANSSEEELRDVLVAAATLWISQEDDGRTLSVSLGSLHLSALLLLLSLFPSPSPSFLLSFPAGLARPALRRFGPEPCPVSAAALHFCAPWNTARPRVGGCSK